MFKFMKWSAGAPADLDVIQPDLVRAQLNRILASDLFKSPRHRLFLSTVVNETLAGRHESLKETVLAREIFCKPDYAPTQDTQVRVTANTIRKKLSAYYKDGDAKDELRIEIPIGHYVAVFSSPATYKRSPRMRVGVVLGLGFLAMACWLIFTLTSRRGPHIVSVSAINVDQRQRIVIRGSGFGHRNGYVGLSRYISFSDMERNWQAGFAGPCPFGAQCAGVDFIQDGIALIVDSWSDSRIVLHGFTGAWGSHGFGCRPSCDLCSGG